jgi:hypothetical protein
MKPAPGYIRFLIKHGEWLGVLDEVVHRLHAPAVIRHPICRAWDRYLGMDGVEDDIPETDPGTTGSDTQ